MIPPAKPNVILVTGGTGLVGWAIQELVKANPNPNETWYFCSSKDADLRDIKQTTELFGRIRPNIVLHLAADVGGLFKNMNNQIQMLRNNILINDNVLSLSFKFNVDKVISCLSTCIFPDKTIYPIDETMIHLGEPHDSNFGYAYAKRLIDIYNKAYHSQFGKKFTSIVPTNIFGPNDNFSLTDGHVIPALIHQCYLAKENNTELIISGTGTSLRQFVYSKDLASLIIWAIREYDDYRPIVMSVDEENEVSIRQVAELITDALGFTGPVTYDHGKPDGQFKKTASNKRLRQLLPNFTFTPIDKAIKETVQWFVENYEFARK